jgi:thermostable 8-oxoguanine DNA glycosylase
MKKMFLAICLFLVTTKAIASPIDNGQFSKDEIGLINSLISQIGNNIDPLTVLAGLKVSQTERNVIIRIAILAIPLDKEIDTPAKLINGINQQLTKEICGTGWQSKFLRNKGVLTYSYIDKHGRDLFALTFTQEKCPKI